MDNLDEKFDEIIRQLKESKQAENPFGKPFFAAIFSTIISALILAALGFIWALYLRVQEVSGESQKTDTEIKTELERRDTEIETKVEALEKNRKKGLKIIDYNFGVLNKDGDKLYKVYDEDE